jgi:hypothetical protein
MGLVALALRRQRDQEGLSAGVHVRRLPMAVVLAAALALQGCSGSVAIQSGLPASSAAPVGQTGVSVVASNWFAGALVLVLVIANVINEAGRPPEGSSEGTAGYWRPLFQPIDRGWVDRGP